jgi:hypothetical protein
MTAQEPRTPHDDEEFPLDDAASDAADAPGAPASSAGTVISLPAGGPPRIVAESPVGGLRPAYGPPPTDATPPFVEEEASPASAPESAAENGPEEAPGAAGPALVALEQTSGRAEAAGRQPGAEVLAEAEPEAAPVAEDDGDEVARAAEVAVEPAQEAETAIAVEAPAPDLDVPDLEAPPSIVRTALSAIEAEAQPDKAAPAIPAGPEESLAGEGEWDDDLSPALAAVLFESPRKPSAATLVEAAPLAREAEVPLLAEKPRPEAGGPIRLMDEGAARTLPITAREHAVSAPDVPLTGKVRYMRLEEPLKGNRGQRIVETWTYFKPDYPGLEGQLVRSVRSEEERFSDGSWRWRYERQYTDRGRDCRAVSANADRTYFERADEIAQRDPLTGKRQQLKEEAGMIFAPSPPREEKRGLLSSLLRRGNHEETGPAAWREATPGEMRQARKEGGAAFKRGLFR